MRKGSQPTDAGFLSNIEPEGAGRIRDTDPVAAQYLRLLIGAHELINNKQRWCLWLVDASPADLRASSELRARLTYVKTMREESPKALTQRDAATPWLFQEIRQPTTNYLAVPRVSSERRDYVPMTMFGPETIASDSLLTIADADVYTFGVLHSSAFNLWNKTVSGRLKSDTRISAEITYNNFPWPSPSTAQREAIEDAAQKVMRARDEYPEASLADLYYPMSMPGDLFKAHEALDKVVLLAYGLGAGATDTEILAELFTRYESLSKADQLPLLEKKKPRKSVGRKT